ncbi:MAG: mobilization protein [Deltaproteobacteria bacterium]
MSTVHFVGGEKGGVGKSVVARLLAQLFIERNLAFAALDADLSHGALVRYYADYTRAVDLTQLDSADQIMDAALTADRRVLVDLPAQSHRFLRRWVETADVLGYAREMNVRLVFWHVTDGGFDSVSHLEQLLSLLGTAVQCVVVKNQGRSHDFTQFDASPAQQRLVELGGQVTTLPELDSAAMYKIDRFGSSFWAAINTSDGERALSPMERRRAKLWLERAHQALDQVGEWRPATESGFVPAQPHLEPVPNHSLISN